METYYIIYKTTCKISNKYYVGMHTTKNLQDGYLGSGKILKCSIKKYGIENHVFEILEYLNDLESLIKRETEIVNETLLSDKMCMNLKPGGLGGGGFWNEEHRKKAQAAGGKAMQMKAIKVHQHKFKTDSEYKENWIDKHKKSVRPQNGENNNFFGKKHSLETKIKMSESQSGEKNSQFGTCWICHPEFKPKKIPSEQLDLYIQLGWKKGRKNVKNI